MTDISYRCGKCGKDGAFLLMTSQGKDGESVRISCEQEGCGRSVSADSVEAAWKKIAEPEVNL